MLISNTFTSSVGTFLTNRSSFTGSSAAKSVLFVKAKSMSMRSLSCAEQLGRQLRRPRLRVAQAVLDLRLGEQVPQVDVVDVRLELLRAPRPSAKKCLQVAADERLVGADRRQQRERRSSRRSRSAGKRPDSARSFHALAHVRLEPRQLEVREEPGLVVHRPARGRARAGGRGRGP